MQKKRIIIVIILAIIATLAAVGVTVGACRPKKGGEVTITFNVNGGKEIPAATVKKGDVVGNVGNTGRSFGAHLHFEIRINNTPVNPKPYFNNIKYIG